MIPVGWREAKIREVAKIDVGRDLVEGQFAETMSDTHRFPIYSNTVEQHGHYGFYDFPEYSAQSVTVVGRGIGLGTAFARTTAFGAIGRLLVLSPKHDAFDVGYLADYLNHGFQIHYESGGIPQLPGKTLGNYSILLPPLPEQRRIAEILSTWDGAIEKTQKLIANARAQKKALMQSLLTGKHRLPGFEGEWQDVALTDVLAIKRAKGKIVSTNAQGLGVPYIGSTSFLGDFSNYTTANDALLCRRDDILMLWDGEYAGKVASGLEGAVSSTVTRYRLDHQKADTDFIIAILEMCSERIRAIREGSGIPHMPGDFEHWFKFRLPQMDEQKALAAVFNSNRSLTDKLKIQLTALRQEKSALMQQLLTGKRRVKLDEREAA